MYQVWLKSLDIYSSYRREKEHTKFDENPLMFTHIIIRKRKRTDRQMDVQLMDRHMDGQTHELQM